MRPSHEELMEAQDALGRARDKEIMAGNQELGMQLNELVLMLFALALKVEHHLMCDRDLCHPDCEVRKEKVRNS